jgi:hypothetical protein
MSRHSLSKAFNYAAVPLYLVNEALQRVAVGIGSCQTYDSEAISSACRRFFEKVGVQGVDVYQMLPLGGEQIQFYASGFFGAAGLNYVANRYFPEENMPEFIAAKKGALCACFSMGALTYWEMTHINTRFDWPDMAVYGVAVAVSYFANSPQTPTLKAQAPQ